MKALRIILNLAFVALLALPGTARADEIDDLFARLAQAEGRELARIEDQIWRKWSQTGSPALDLLLRRGRAAVDAGQNDVAIEHLSALMDHAPEFAEAYNIRATAWFREGHYGPALEDIRMALMLNPRHFDALSGLAIILDEMGKSRDALAAWRLVEALHPNRDGLAETIARLERELGDTAL